MSRDRLLAGLYHRVSTRDQNETLAREELRRAAEVRRAGIVLDIEEKVSSRKADRPGLLRIMQAIDRYEINLIIVWKLDRFGRSLIDLVNNLERVQRRGALFVATSQGIELGRGADPGQKFSFNILAAAAEYERDMISERTHLGLDDALRRGVVLGRPKRCVQLGILRTAAEVEAELAACGGSVRALARRLNLPEPTVRRQVARVKKGIPAALSEEQAENGPRQ